MKWSKADLPHRMMKTAQKRKKKRKKAKERVRYS